MNLVLVDASAWFDYLRSGENSLSTILEQLIDGDRAALCGISLAEVRQGLRPHEERDVLDLFEILPFIEMTREDFDQAGRQVAELRRRGITVPIMDGLVAQLAVRHELPLLENDGHFRHFEALVRFPWRAA